MVFDVNKYLDCDQFNQLYDLDQIKKRHKKYRQSCLKAWTCFNKNNKLDARNSQEKRAETKEIIEKLKVDVIATKQRRPIKNQNESDTRDNIDPDQANNKY